MGVRGKFYKPEEVYLDEYTLAMRQERTKYKHGSKMCERVQNKRDDRRSSVARCPVIDRTVR